MGAVVGGEGTSAGARSVAVVLFTDMVGSTELRSRLGDDAAEELRRKHDDLVETALRTNRGRLVKHLGDGVMATFTAASDAVAAGIRIQQVLERHNRSGAAALHVRIGMSAGDVVVEKEDCFGTPVIEAARLCAAARGGQVLLSDIVRLLAGSAGGHQFAPVGELELKGLPAPLPSFEVTWQPLPAAPLPLPSLLTRMGRIFVGREEQTDGLLRLWKETAAGKRRVALLAGEPGIGKTRLAAELAALVHDEGAVVLAGRCDEDLGVPYQPFVEALRHFVDHGRLSKQRLGRYGGELVRLIPELAERVADLAPPLQSDPETERYRLFDAVAAWLGTVSAEVPVLLVLDDIQWATKPTLLLLRHLVRSSEPLRILVICTYRDTEIGHELSEVLADLRRETGIERMPLAGLDPPGVVAFVQEASGHTLDDEGFLLARAIHEETQGNPFFAREVLRHLAETGELGHQGQSGMGVVGAGIPESVRDVIGRRLSHLSRTANEVLRVAAVAGAEFEGAVVQAAGDFDDEAFISSVEEAATAHLVIEAADRYRFAHALVRDTLYEGLSGARGVVLHRRLAEAIEAVHADGLDDQLAALSHHWARAGAGDAARALDYAARAGDRALAQLAHDDAIVYYRQAIDLLQVGAHDVAKRCDLLIALGEAQRRAGDPAHRETLLDAADLARQADDQERLARAALANNRGFFSVSVEVDAARVAALEAALAASGSHDTPMRAQLLVTLAAELAFAPDHDRRHRLINEALAMARRLGDPKTLGHVLGMAFMPTFGRADREELCRHRDELLAVAEQVGDPALSFWANMWGRYTAMLLADVPTANRLLITANNLAEELAQPVHRWGIALNKSFSSRIAGRLEDAESWARRAFEAGEAGGFPDAFRTFGLQIFWIRYDQGRLHEMLGLVTRAAAKPTAPPLNRAAFCLVSCQLHRHDEARGVFNQLASEAIANPTFDFAWLYGTTILAEIAAAMDDVDKCEALYALLAPRRGFVAHVGSTGSGPVSHYLGLLATTLGDHDQADEDFGQAASIAEDFGAPIWLARTRLEWARMLLLRLQPDDAKRADELLGQALSTARELGLANLVGGALELLK